MSETLGPPSNGPAIRVLADGSIVYVDCRADPEAKPVPPTTPWVWSPDALRSGLASPNVGTSGEGPND